MLSLLRKTLPLPFPSPARPPPPTPPPPPHSPPQGVAAAAAPPTRPNDAPEPCEMRLRRRLLGAGPLGGGGLLDALGLRELLLNGRALVPLVRRHLRDGGGGPLGHTGVVVQRRLDGPGHVLRGGQRVWRDGADGRGRGTRGLGFPEVVQWAEHMAQERLVPGSNPKGQGIYTTGGRGLTGRSRNAP